MSIEKYTQDGQDAKVIDKVHGKIMDMLTAGESINYIAIQKKPAVTLLPDSITVSNKRIFLCEFTKLGLATNFEIFSWQDVKDIVFKEEIFGSKVTVIPFTGENLTIDYIPKVQARKLYQLIKSALDGIQKDKLAQKDKIVIENKPVFQTPISPAPKPVAQSAQNATEQQRENPFKSAETENPTSSTGSFFSSLNESSKPSEKETPIEKPQTPSAVNTEEDEITKKLSKLKNLFDRQLISQAEYENKKAEILKDL